MVEPTIETLARRLDTVERETRRMTQSCFSGWPRRSG